MVLYAPILFKDIRVHVTVYTVSLGTITITQLQKNQFTCIQNKVTYLLNSFSPYLQHLMFFGVRSSNLVY